MTTHDLVNKEFQQDFGTPLVQGTKRIDEDWRRIVGHSYMPTTGIKVRNGLVPMIEFDSPDSKATYRLIKPLRVSVEIHSEDECLAFLLLDKSISGYGESVNAAIEDMVIMLVQDFLFYTSKEESELTQDAIELKRTLQELFEN